MFLLPRCPIGRHIDSKLFIIDNDSMLTIKDLEEIEQLIYDKTKFLPTKDEFYKMMDELMGEIKTVREEMAMMNNRSKDFFDRLGNHEIRIRDLEKQTGLIPADA